ncbi:MAG: hypothetical protein MJ177_02065 [Clostridia bacterium]|nr:hypothetical protein [Clostridia bacterium]
MVRIQQTILERYIRNLLVGQCGFILMWYIVRMSRFTLFYHSELMNSYLWYLYYAPIIFIAVLGFFSAMLVEKNEEQAKHTIKKYSFIFVIAAALLLLVVTNNFHKLVFVFEKNTLYDDYTYNAGYYCVAAFVVLLHFLTFVICTQKSVTYVSKKKVWVVPAIYSVLVLYLILYIKGVLSLRDVLGFEPVKFPEVYIFFTMLIWESYMQTGLIPVNTGYDGFIKNSSLSIKIENDRGEVFLVSKGFRETEDNVSKSNVVEHSIKSTNKIVSWITDISDINALTEKLNEVNAELSEENEMIEQKLLLSQEKIAIEKQNMLYDKMYSATESQMVKINSILQNVDADGTDFKKCLSRVCILASYVKRKSNLILICENAESINIEELAFCFRESVDYLNLYGVVSSFDLKAAGAVNGKAANEMYDCFENILEAGLDNISAVMLTLSKKDGRAVLGVELSTDGQKLPEVIFEGRETSFSYSSEDNVVYASVSEGVT